jgi:hypothetical protein
MKKTILLTLLMFFALAGLMAQTPVGKTDAAITIDGTQEAAWDAAPVFKAVDPHSWCYDGWLQGWFGREVSMQTEEDFSLQWSTLWDANNLYLLFKLKDDVVTTGDLDNMGAGDKLWMMDCIEMKIGGYFYRFGYNRDSEVLIRPTEGQINPGGYTQKSVLVSGGYNVEVKIPWSTLVNDSVSIGLNPAVDNTFKLWVSGADLDNPAGKAWNDQDGHIHWPYDNGQEDMVLANTAAKDLTPPSAPLNLKATDVTATSAKLSWDAVDDADLMSYLLYLNGVAEKLVLDATELEVTLAAEKVYNYLVKSFDGQNLSEASNLVSISTMAPTTSILIGRASSNITVDGVRESSWDVAPEYVAVDPTTWTPNPDHQSLEDCSFEWSALWDEDSLYIFVSVMDDIPTTGDIETVGSSAKSWMNDNVEVSIAPIDGTGDPWFFRFGYNREPLDLGLLDDPAKNTPVGSRYATSEQEGGWTMEAVIPWKILSIDPSAFTGLAEVGSILTVGIYVADLDDPTATAWDKLSGHVQWPKGYSTGELVLAENAPFDNTPPAAPSGVTADNVTFNSATLSWNESSEEDVIGYLVLKGEAPMTYTTSTSIDLTLEAETEYTFTVISVDPQNLSVESQAANFTTGTPPSLKSISISEYKGTFPNPFDDLDLWEGLPKHNVEYANTADPSDFSCYFKALWDMDNLYVQISIIDPPPVINGKTNPWENDNTEVHFDLQNAKDGTSCEDVDGEKYQKDNMQYRFIAFEPGRQHGSTPAPDWTNLTQVDYELYDEAGVTVIGWYVEITFPWTTLNLTADGSFTFTPAKGNELGVEIHAFDYDDDGTANGCIWSSYGNLPPNRDNSQYGTFVLGEPVSVHSSGIAELKVYPNPAEREVRFNVPTPGYNMIMTDFTGKTVLTKATLPAGINTIEISDLASGIYMITLSNGSQMLKSKIVK